MADRLAAYIHEQIAKGHSRSEIRSALMRYGYPASAIDSALAGLSTSKFPLHLSPMPIAAIIIILGVVVSLLFFFVSGPDPVSTNAAQLILSTQQTKIAAGDDIVVSTKLIDIGNEATSDVYVTFDAVHTATNTIVSLPRQTIPAATGTLNAELQLPATLQSGSYIVRGKATYGDKQLIATTSITVEPAENTPPLLQPPTRPPPPETQVPTPQPKPPTTSSLSTFDVIADVERTAPQNPARAADMCAELSLPTSRDLCYDKIAEVLRDIRFCDQIVKDVTKDICIKNIAFALRQSELCEDILDEGRKDNCYIAFVTEYREYGVCDKLKNKYYAQSCTNLRQLSELNISNLDYDGNQIDPNSVLQT